MCDDWEKIKEELSEIGPFDVNRALEPDFLRKCFATLLVTTDNKKRKKLESGLKRLSSKPQIVFVLSKLILEDSDVNIRLYSCSFLANSTARLVDTIVESESSNNMFESLANILFMGLSHLELPNNLRTFLLNGLGTFMAKTFPDIWSDGIERITQQNGNYNPAYVFESLAIFAQVSKSLPINFHAKQEREALMWRKFTSVIEPYTMNVLSQVTNVTIWEKLALMLAEWGKLRDPLMNVIRPIVTKMIENGCYNPRSLTTLINGFNELDFEMTESRLFMCSVLINNVHAPLLEAVSRILRDSSAGFEGEEAVEITELIHVIFEFYANIMNRSSRCFLFHNSEKSEERLQHEFIITQMFDFAAQVLSLCYRRYDISNAIGIFYSTIQQTLVDDFYNIENYMAETMLNKGQQSIMYVFEASTINDSIGFDSTEFEEIGQFREILLDLFLLLDALSLKLNNEMYSNKYVELLQKCVVQKDFPRISAMISYFKELPMNQAYADSLTNLGLTWETLNFDSLTDEQNVDFFQNYFGFVTCLFKNNNIKQKYENLIRETLKIAIGFLFNQSNMLDKSLFQLNHNVIKHKENADAYIIECFKFLNDFSSQIEFDLEFCQQLCAICTSYYQESNKREVVKLATKSLADCVSFNGHDSTKIGLAFFELLCSKLHPLCMSLKETQNKKEVYVKINEYVEDLGTFCASLSEKAVSNIGPDLAEIIWEAVLFMIQEDIDAEVAYKLVDPILKVITPEIYKKFALALPNFIHKYPDLVSRILRSSLTHPTDFLIENVVPVIFDFVWAVFSVSMSTKEIQIADQAALELVFVFFRRHVDLFLQYISKLSSMSPVQNFIHASVGISLKNITQSFTDEGIVRGLRVIEVIADIRNEDVLNCLQGTQVHIIPAILDLIFTVYFSCAQMSIAKILYFFALFSPEEFKSQILNHKVGTLKGADLVVSQGTTRPLIQRHIILWNNAWNKEQPDD